MMKRWVILFLSILLLALMLAACGGEVAALPTATPSLTLTSTPVLISTSTETLVPFHTPSPLETQIAIPAIPQKTLWALATLDALVTQNPELDEYHIQDCPTCYPSRLEISPDGLWAAFSSPMGGGNLKIYRIDGKKKWEGICSELAGDAYPCGEGSVQIKHWSSDGNYLYVIPLDGSEGGDAWLWRNFGKLIRIDLETGEWMDTQLAPAASFSPDGRFVAYRSGRELHVHELKTGEEKVYLIPSRFLDFGRFTWSPDCNKILLIADKETVEKDVNQMGITILLLNLMDESLQVIVEDDLRFIYPIEWTQENLVLVKEIYEWGVYHLDLRTLELIPLE